MKDYKINNEQSEQYNKFINDNIDLFSLKSEEFLNICKNGQGKVQFAKAIDDLHTLSFIGKSEEILGASKTEITYDDGVTKESFSVPYVKYLNEQQEIYYEKQLPSISLNDLVNDYNFSYKNELRSLHDTDLLILGNINYIYNI